MNISSLNIGYLVFVLYSPECQLRKTCTSLHSIFVYVFHIVLIFVAPGLCTKSTQYAEWPLSV